jgi:pilus assembly protein CpaD
MRLFIALSMTTVLSGCYADRPIITGNYPNDVQQRHPVAIREGERTVELFIGSHYGALKPSQQAEVLAFAQAWKRETNGALIIDIPNGTANAIASSEAMREIKSILHGAGVPAQAIVIRNYRPIASVKLATVRLIYPKLAASAGPCGLWPRDLGPTYDLEHFENRDYWNFGCAYQQNMAAMVENPADLVQPREETPAYAARRALMLGKYRQGVPTATTNPDADKAKISDTGK